MKKRKGRERRRERNKMFGLENLLKGLKNRMKDKRADKIMQNPKVILSEHDSGIIDYSLINEVAFAKLRDLSYPAFTDELLKLIEEANKKNSNSYARINVVPVKDYRTGEDFLTQKGHKIYTFEMGNPNYQDVKHKIVVEGTTHGGERIHSLTAAVIALSLAKPGDLREKVLEEAHISIIPASDPDGWHKETRAYVNMAGEETRNPVVRGMYPIGDLFGWDDTNAVFGRNSEEAKSSRIRSIEKHYMEKFGPPTLYNSLHETVMHGSHLFYGNGGVMIMVEDYFTDEERDVLDRLRYALDKSQKLGQKLRKKGSFLLDMRYMEEALKNHPSFEDTISIRNYIRSLGLRTYEDKFEQIKREFPSSEPEQSISIAESLLIDGPLFMKCGIVVAPGYYRKKAGTIGRTIETFAQSETERVAQGAAFVDGSIRKEVLRQHFK